MGDSKYTYVIFLDNTDESVLVDSVLIRKDIEKFLKEETNYTDYEIGDFYHRGGTPIKYDKFLGSLCVSVFSDIAMPELEEYIKLFVPCSEAWVVELTNTIHMRKIRPKFYIIYDALEKCWYNLNEENFDEKDLKPSEIYSEVTF